MPASISRRRIGTGSDRGAGCCGTGKVRGGRLRHLEPFGPFFFCGTEALRFEGRVVRARRLPDGSVRREHQGDRERDQRQETANGTDSWLAPAEDQHLDGAGVEGESERRRPGEGRGSGRLRRVRPTPEAGDRHQESDHQRQSDIAQARTARGATRNEHRGAGNDRHQDQRDPEPRRRRSVRCPLRRRGSFVAGFALRGHSLCVDSRNSAPGRRPTRRTRRPS